MAGTSPAMTMWFLATLFSLDAGVLDDLGPGLDLLGEIRLERLRVAHVQGEAELGDTLLHVGLVQDRDDRARQLVEDGLGRIHRCEEGGPGFRIRVGDALL